MDLPAREEVFMENRGTVASQLLFVSLRSGRVWAAPPIPSGGTHRVWLEVLPDPYSVVDRYVRGRPRASLRPGLHRRIRIEDRAIVVD